MLTLQSYALTYTLPGDGASVVGEIKHASAITGDNLVSIARRYGLGYVELMEANPEIKADSHLDSADNLLLPTEFILPDAPHRGLVVNLAELRIYFYPPNTRDVMTFPVGIGRAGWNTPLGLTYVAWKQKDPTWHVSSTIKKARLLEGVVLPDKVEPGPDNPLGQYAIHLGFASILIHGSNDSGGIGRRSSSGCIRMQPEAIESFFDDIAVRSPVMVVDQPIKIGWQDNSLYMEVHVPLENDQGGHDHDLTVEAKQLIAAMTRQRAADIDWAQVALMVQQKRGYPLKIGVGIGSIPVMSVPLNSASLSPGVVSKKALAKPVKKKRKYLPHFNF